MEKYKATVQTKYDGRISLWSDIGKGSRLCYVADGEQVEVLGPVVSGTMAPAKAKGMEGFADTRYLVDREALVPSPKEIQGLLIPLEGMDISQRALFQKALQNAVAVEGNAGGQ